MKHFSNILSRHLLMTLKTFNDQCSHHIEISQLICRANQLSVFCMMGTLVVKGLIRLFHSNVAFHVEASPLIYRTNKITGFSI